MKVSFDFDGTLTDRNIREIAKALLNYGTDVFILTSRFSDTMKDVYELANRLRIKRENVLCTNLQDKGDYLKEHNLNFDIHFDDDYFETDSINNKTATTAILVSLDLHPNNIEITKGGLIVPKTEEE